MDRGETPSFIDSNGDSIDRIHPPWAAISLRAKARRREGWTFFLSPEAEHATNTSTKNGQNWLNLKM